MYGKCTILYESPTNCGYYVHAQTVCTRPLFGGRGLGTRLRLIHDYSLYSMMKQLPIKVGSNGDNSMELKEVTNFYQADF